MELSIFHDGQFFIGLVEYREEDRVKLVKFTFGTEPNSAEIFNFIYGHLDELINQTKVSIEKRNQKVNLNVYKGKLLKNRNNLKLQLMLKKQSKEQEMKKYRVKE